MSVIENKATEIGDVLVIKGEVPILGLIALSGFIDTVIGETGNRFFFKKFRFSTDGIFFSAFKELTVANLQDIQVQSNQTFFVEYQYIRQGIDNTGVLEWNDTTLEGDFEELVCGKIYDNSIFNQFFDCNDIKVINWCVNVLVKAYKKGIVPNYIERGANQNDNGEDEDFINFWRTITCFFALLVIYAREFENFSSNKTLLIKFLENRGAFLCDDIDLIDLVDLIHLKENFFDEMRQRGTIQVARRKGENGKAINGEILSLICFQDCEEFLFSLTEPNKVGWNIGSSSPLYKGLNIHPMLIKGYEQTADFVDLAKYPLINSGFSSIVTDGSREVLQIDNVPIGEIAGIGDVDFTKAIDVSSVLDYEISFSVKQLTLENNLTFKVLGFDKSNNQISFQKITDLSNSNIFFEKIKLNKNDIYYQVRGYIYSQVQSAITGVESQVNIGFGTHLRFPNDNVCRIIPVVILDNEDELDISGAISIHDFKVRPLRTEYSTGFIAVSNFIQMFAQNNNGTLDDEKVEQTIRRYLIPYNNTIKHNWLTT